VILAGGHGAAVAYLDLGRGVRSPLTAFVQREPLWDTVTEGTYSLRGACPFTQRHPPRLAT
jgi:hypothetical protein